MAVIKLEILALIALILVTSGCISSDLSSNKTPEETVKNYITYLNDEDTRSSYEMLSSSVKDNTEYSEYQSEIITAKSPYNSQGNTFEVLQAETQSESENKTTLRVTVTKESSIGGPVSPTSNVQLIKEEGLWKINQTWNPFGLV